MKMVPICVGKARQSGVYRMCVSSPGHAWQVPPEIPSAVCCRDLLGIDHDWVTLQRKGTVTHINNKSDCTNVAITHHSIQARAAAWISCVQAETQRTTRHVLNYNIH